MKNIFPLFWILNNEIFYYFETKWGKEGEGEGGGGREKLIN